MSFIYMYSNVIVLKYFNTRVEFLAFFKFSHEGGQSLYHKIVWLRYVRPPL